MRFIVFDVETPNWKNNRMSAIGITVIENGIITDEYYTLINPETSFDYFNIRLTGISEEAVYDKPSFDTLWDTLREYFDSGILVAHNAVFDLGVLKRCLESYNIEWKSTAPYLCTVQMGRRLLPGISHKLNDMCEYYDLPLKHHHAGSDSNACAQILLRYIESGADINSFIKTYRFE